MTDEEWAARIVADCGEGDPTRDQEIDHSRADEILRELLTCLGYKKTVAAYDRVGKWYA